LPSVAIAPPAPRHNRPDSDGCHPRSRCPSLSALTQDEKEQILWRNLESLLKLPA